MNKRLLKILESLNKHGESNYYELKIYTGLFNPEQYYKDMFYLMENDYIWFNNGFKHKYEFDKKSKSHSIIPFELPFHITIEGQNILEQIHEDNRRFKINSILVPIIVSFITSFLTAYFTVRLLP